MLSRILFYITGLLLTSLGLSIIIIYLSYNNVGFSLIENIFLIIKNPASYLFILGCTISLLALFYDSIKNK